MVKTVLLIGLGGFAGSVSRFYLQEWFVRFGESKIPWGTFTANILGSFIIGIVYAFVEKQGYLSHEIRLLLAVGFCGGFTTFSSFAAENYNLLRTADFVPFAFYTMLSILSGLIMVWLGIHLIKIIT